MSELKSFTAEEMKGVPTFDCLYGGLKYKFLVSNGEDMETYDYNHGLWDDTIESIKCNPIDRMNAIAKNLFELMPDMSIIQEIYGVDVIGYDIYYNHKFKLSINPFLHTGKTSITREEAGL